MGCLINYFCMSQELYFAGYIYSSMLSYSMSVDSPVVQCLVPDVPIPFQGLPIDWRIALCHLYKDRIAASLH